MPSTTLKRRWTEEGMRGKAPKKYKKVKRQKAYHSSSEDEDEAGARDAPQDFAPVSLEDSDEDEQSLAKSKVQPKLKAKIAAPKPILKAPKEEFSDEDDEDEDDAPREDDEASEADSDASSASSMSETSTNNAARKVRKRNDPEAFATSISRILNTKLTTQKRAEPILARSKAARDTNKELADHKLTLAANRKLLADKRAAQEKGRVKDVLGLKDEGVSTAEIVGEEKKLRRTAQRGVIKLFNAVRAAQVKAETAEKEARAQGIVGMKAREEKIKEMSKQGFLDMISGGSKKEGSVEV